MTTIQKQLMNEASDSEILDKVEAIVKAEQALMSLRGPLEKSGLFKKKDIDFALSPVPYFRIKAGTKVLLIFNKRYADGAERIVGDIAIGFEGK